MQSSGRSLSLLRGTRTGPGNVDSEAAVVG